MGNKQMVTNTSNISVRVGSAVVSPGKSLAVDSKALEKMRAKGASVASQALGASLMNGVPTVTKTATKEAKAEASTIIDKAKVEAEGIIDDATTAAAAVENLMIENKKALAAIGK